MIKNRLAQGAAALLLLLTTIPASAQAARTETLEYRWHLHGIAGRLASMVIPGHGNAELRSRPAPSGGIVTELEITSPQAAEDEHFLYGSETGPLGTTKEAWSSYLWHDKQRSHREELAGDGVVDIASGIRLIRRLQPDMTMLRIWSDGHIYPVVVRNEGAETVRVPAGDFRVNRFSIRGRDLPGQRMWKGGLDLWLTADAAATPVQIEVRRGWASLKLELLPDDSG